MNDTDVKGEISRATFEGMANENLTGNVHSIIFYRCIAFLFPSTFLLFFFVSPFPLLPPPPALLPSFFLSSFFSLLRSFFSLLSPPSPSILCFCARCGCSSARSI